MLDVIVNAAQIVGKGAIVNTLHFAGLACGVYVIWRLFKSNCSTRLKWGVAAGSSLGIFAFVFVVSAPTPIFSDFTKAYWTAGRQVWSGWEGLAPLFEGAHGFVNLPIVALLFAPFGLMPQSVAALAFFFLGVGATIFIWRVAADAYNFGPLERAISLFLAAGFGPLVYSLREGNASHLLLVPLLLGALDLRRGRDWRAGALFAFAALIKPPLALLGILAALRGRWRVVCGGAALLAAASASSLLLFGWEAHLVWYKAVVAPFAGGALPSFNAQSIASIVSRIEQSPASYWSFDPAPLSQAGRWAVWASTAALLGVTVWAAAPWRGMRTTHEFEGEVMLSLLFVLLAGALSWSHYFCWALLPTAWAWAHARNAAHASHIRRWLLVWTVLAAPAVFESWRMVLGGYAPFSWLLMSHTGIGAIFLFAACVAVRRRMAVQEVDRRMPATTASIRNSA